MKVDKLHKVSIVIPSYNGLKYIRVCLESLYSQSFQSFDIIIVDNASQDGSCEFILENYPKEKLISLKENYGFSRAVNEGIKASNSEYVVLLNNDTEVDKFWLQNLVKCIEDDENIFSCCSKMMQYSERNKIDDAGDGYTILGWAYKRGDGASWEKYTKNQKVFSSCAGAAIYRKDLLEKVGYFDESFFAYMEDVDISYRAKLNGYKNIYCSKAIVYHIGSATSGSKYNSFKVRLAGRNNIYLVIKNMPNLQLIVNLPFLMIGFLVKVVFFYKIGFGNDYINGVKEAFNKYSLIKKTKYYNKNLANYLKVEYELIINTFYYILLKLKKSLRHFIVILR
ncbi:glycosyltransferase family 2 protein [Clostridium sp. FP1]|uniref:glycosyltransferase family 2 protein n=1 Tax=Clostridium sp. FP1 TaxID=2724076 RepID=UPI0013E94FA5|nr:glycosyltransferase family 2 protein [Clostridium sp. FP1]MBZ9636643.1 glycosyltransferase family 2 protein [Clostridium sp. FP1]